MGQYLLKFFECKEYQDAFLDGKLYMNTLKHFKEDENLDLNRADKFETIISHEQKKADFIQIGKLVFSKDEITSGALIKQTVRYDHCNIFSMYALWSSKKNEELMIDDKNKRFGQYCVCVVNPIEFISRVDAAVESKKIACHYHKVEYLNKNENYQDINDDKIPFTKFDNFEYQKEFRIVIDTKKDINEPYVLDIGNIKDIVWVTTIDEINEKLRKFYRDKLLV